MAEVDEDDASPQPNPTELFPTPEVKLPGYDKLGGPSECVWFKAPPQHGMVLPEGGEELKKIIELDTEEAQSLFSNFMKKNSSCFVGQSSICVSDVSRCLAWHYRLESFVEERAACWTFEPYLAGRVVEPVDCSKVSEPWDLDMMPTRLFHQHEKQTVVPHTSVVQPCHQCLGQRTVPCWKCRGRAMLKCSSCRGNGKKTQSHGGLVSKVSCRQCNGVGRKRCHQCQAMSKLPCPTCKGEGNLVFSVRIRVHWRIYDTDRMADGADLPHALIKTVKGLTILEEEAPRVHKIQNFDDPSVSSISEEMIANHFESSGGKILCQRHSLRVVPIFKCTYTRGDGESNFFLIYGVEKKIFSRESFSSCVLL